MVSLALLKATTWKTSEKKSGSIFIDMDIKAFLDLVARYLLLTLSRDQPFSFGRSFALWRPVATFLNFPTATCTRNCHNQLTCSEYQSSPSIALMPTHQAVISRLLTFLCFPPDIATPFFDIFNGFSEMDLRR